jgi:hypothetical protein
VRIEGDVAIHHQLPANVHVVLEGRVHGAQVRIEGDVAIHNQLPANVHVVLEGRVHGAQVRIEGDVAIHHQLPANVNLFLIIHYQISPPQSIGRVFVAYFHVARIRVVKNAS